MLHDYGRLFAQRVTGLIPSTCTTYWSVLVHNTDPRAAPSAWYWCVNVAVWRKEALYTVIMSYLFYYLLIFSFVREHLWSENTLPFFLGSSLSISRLSWLRPVSLYYFLSTCCVFERVLLLILSPLVSFICLSRSLSLSSAGCHSNSLSDHPRLLLRTFI